MMVIKHSPQQLINPHHSYLYPTLYGVMVLFLLVQVRTFSYIMVQVSIVSLIIILLTKNLHIINIQQICFHLGASPRWVRK